MNEEIIPANELPAKIPAKKVFKPRTYKKIDTTKPLTKRQLQIFTLFESGQTQQQIADQLGLHPSYIGNTLHNHADRYTCRKDYHKLNGINILNAKIEEKRNNPSRKDVVDIVMDLHELIEPKKESITIIDKQLNINTQDLDNLPLEDKLERIRRALSDGSAN